MSASYSERNSWGDEQTYVEIVFDVAEGPCVLEGAVIDFDPATKRARAIETVRVREAQ